jgi:DnaJ-domain-containing protein 1
MAPRDVEDEVPAYACCSVGIGRWFWVAWDSEAEARACSPALASGYESSAVAAERKAIESVGPRGKPLPAKWASGYKRGGGGAARAGGMEGEGAGGTGIRPRAKVVRPVGGFKKGGGTSRLAFVYAAFENDSPDARGQVVVVKHRIVKQNPRKIYIDRNPFDEEEWAHRGEDGDGAAADFPKTRTLAIDREMLRREGRFRHRLSHHDMYFYAREEDGIRDVEATLTSKHAWCATLGVQFPCSAETVKAAYRRLAKTAHPDAGGDPTRFRAVEQAYRDALTYFAVVDGATTLAKLD